MKSDSNIISAFDCKDFKEFPFAVDFAAAKKLDAAGSTCDVYECTIQHRRVFVKRLKEEFRNNPLYRAAFDKEYDLGVTLSHKSLPRYVGFGTDYIMLDFIEGETLADLMKRDDVRLKDKRFVRTLLGELIDVVEYLHNRNIVHCDIKADNIIVSPYADRPVTLIDFDKAYSSWLDSTYGNAGKYGCTGCADGQIDFKGIGLLAGKLGLKKLAGVCGKGHVTISSARRALKNRQHYVWLIILAVVIAIAGVTGALLSVDNDSDDGESVINAHRVLSDSAQAVVPNPATVVPLSPEPRIKKPAIDNTWISALIARQSARIEEYKRQMWQVIDCDTVAISKKYAVIDDCNISVGQAKNQIIHEAVEHYRDLNEPDVQLAVRNNPGWKKIEEDERKMWQTMADWRRRIKESQRSSGRLVSQPDTTRGAVPNAPHR